MKPAILIALLALSGCVGPAGDDELAMSEEAQQADTPAKIYGWAQAASITFDCYCNLGVYDLWQETVTLRGPLCSRVTSCLYTPDQCALAQSDARNLAYPCIAADAQDFCETWHLCNWGEHAKNIRVQWASSCPGC
jgi:hypothetical protein